MFAARLRAARMLPIVLLCLILAACQSWPLKRQGGESEQGGRDTEAEAPTVDSVGQAIILLQDGKEGRAETMLLEILERNPGSSTAKLLLAQIRQPPEELLGEAFEEIEVLPGDSLSAIAGRTIDNELLFYSLARLNGIEMPRLLQPGQRVRVPVVEPVEAVESVEADSVQAEARSASDQAREAPRPNAELPATARRLMQRERYRQAYALLLSSARAGKLEAEGDRLLASASVALAEAACRQDDPEQALKVLNQASPWLSVGADGEFAVRRGHIEARLSLDRAEQALAQGEHGAAFDALLVARERDDDLRQRHGGKLERLENALVEHYHDGALSAWRDQRVELSVELWERVMRIDPGFEPARRYLERARRAREELKALERG